MHACTYIYYIYISTCMCTYVHKLIQNIYTYSLHDSIGSSTIRVHVYLHVCVTLRVCMRSLYNAFKNPSKTLKRDYNDICNEVHESLRRAENIFSQKSTQKGTIDPRGNVAVRNYRIHPYIKNSSRHYL